MSRFPHYLPRNHSNEMPSNIIWVDTETKYRLDHIERQHHYLWFGWACFQRRKNKSEWTEPDWFRFSSIPEFWEWVNSKCRKKTRLYILAHNLGFDLPVLHGFTELPKIGFKLTNAIADAPPLILTYRRDSNTIKLIDTLNIWRTSLENIGNSIGYKKLPMPKPDASGTEWDKYCMQDTDIIRVAMLQWLDFLVEHDLGYFSPTLASQSFNTYRHRFMHTPIFIDTKTNALELSRSSYVGGRTECFKLGTYKDKFYYVDVISMYPAVMRKNFYPCKLVSVYGRPEPHEIERWKDVYIMIADCEIKTDQPIYPVMLEERLMFPIGEYRVSLAHPEFMCALERGHVTHVHRVACYEKADLFTDFIDTIYQLRQKAKDEGNTTQAWLFKILMNSLYGKFGQRGRRYEKVGECDPNEISVWLDVDGDTGHVTNRRRFGGIEQEWVSENEGRHSFPAIASVVTSYARQLLWNSMEQAGLENVFYCDTDSMVINQVGFDRIQDVIDKTTIGRWELEATFDEITLHGPKDYTFGNKSRTKGVRANALWLGPNKVEQDKFVGLKGLIREANLSGPIVHKQVKNLSRDYTKANVYGDGSTSPLIVTLSGESLSRVYNWRVM